MMNEKLVMYVGIGEQKKKRNSKIICSLFIIFCSLLVLLSCNDPPVSSPCPSIPAGYGTVLIQLSADSTLAQPPRTVFPLTVFDRFVYTFTKAGETDAEEETPDNDGVFLLEVGNYTVEVRVYIGSEEPYTLAATGQSPEFSVSSGDNDPVEVLLSGVTTEEEGKFSYTITFPADAEAEITLQRLPLLSDVTLAPNSLSEENGITQTLELETGSYLLTVLVSKNDFFAGISEAIHIYPFLLTVYTKDFDDSDLLAAVPIRNTEIIVTAPVKGATPDTTAALVNNGSNFTIGAVSWLPDDNLFLGGTVYTATVTLAANSRYTFTGLNSATINGQSAAVSNNTGTAVTLSYTFSATDERTVTDIMIKTQPTKLTYTHGDPLDLTGLVITLTYDDTTTEDVAAVDFTDKHITASPSHSNHLVHLAHNGQPVTITYGELAPLVTNTLAVNPKVITFTVDPIEARTYTGNPHTPSVTVRDEATALTLGTDYTIEYTDNVNAGTAAITITGEGNYTGSTGSADFTINPKVITFTVDPIPAQTYTGSAYTPAVTVKDDTTTLTLNIDYAVEYADNTNAGTAAVTITGEGNYEGSSGNTDFIIDKAGGAVVDVPTLNTRTYNSIAVNPVAASTGQTVEYAINITGTAPEDDDVWQTDTVFDGLDAGTSYFIFARAAGNDNYETGTASSSLAVKTLQTVSHNRFEYYWVDAHGSLVTTSGGAVTVDFGGTLTITAQGTGYVVKHWHLNGVDTGQSGNTYIFSSTTLGKHTVGLFVEKDGKPYNTNITITVQ